MERIAHELVAVARQMITAAPRLKGIIDDFEKVAFKYRGLGATDTEPRGTFTDLMVRALRGDDWKAPSVRDWQLYSQPGHKAVAKALTKAAQKAYFAIQTNPHKDVQELAHYYGWDRWV